MGFRSLYGNVPKFSPNIWVLLLESMDGRILLRLKYWKTHIDFVILHRIPILLKQIIYNLVECLDFTFLLWSGVSLCELILYLSPVLKWEEIVTKTFIERDKETNGPLYTDVFSYIYTYNVKLCLFGDRWVSYRDLGLRFNDLFL